MTDTDDKSNIWDRLEQLQNQIWEIETALSHILTTQDEPDNGADDDSWSESVLSDVCDACNERADFISAYVIHNAGWFFGVCDRDGCASEAPDGIVKQAVAVWNAIQNERTGDT